MNPSVLLKARKVGLYILAGATGGVVGKFIADYVIKKYEEDAAWKEAVKAEEEANGPLVKSEDMAASAKEALDRYDPDREPVVPLDIKHTPAKPIKPVDYSQIKKNGESKISIDEAVKTFLKEESVDAPIKKEPYVIADDEYNEGQPNFSKIGLIYYAFDETLTMEDETIIPDPRATIGTALSRFGELSNDADIVYVRNENESSDYEVVKVQKSYRVDVLGEIAEPVPVKQKPKQKPVNKRNLLQDDDKIKPQVTTRPRVKKVPLKDLDIEKDESNDDNDEEE